ncbi:hypothetical protein LOC67_17890 [Stieleria sp. JC731]|uniref:hypothetical protein n=1 Tax=Pirellulaceae TaxID=2691357 RepID=UPI001E330D13|nr:hypothetical protein [Stieleria sp. JC731]MCC9602425.1 hypothetical protein [Stieleria sp. JC731]
MKITSIDCFRRIAIVAAATVCVTSVASAQYPKPGTYESNEAAPRLFNSSLYEGSENVFEDEFPVFADDAQSATEIAEANALMNSDQPETKSVAAASIARNSIKQAPEKVLQKPQSAPMGVLVDDVSSSSDRSFDKPTVSELRQARAQLREKQRLQRMERNLWYGYEPLRPNWNAVPMTHSRYNYRSTIVVPVYYGVR